MEMSSIQMLKNYFGNNANEFIFKEAEKMFEQEITKAFDEGQEYEYQYHINNAPKFDSETYYKETFKND